MTVSTGHAGILATVVFPPEADKSAKQTTAGGSVKRSLTRAIPKGFAFEAPRIGKISK